MLLSLVVECVFYDNAQVILRWVIRVMREVLVSHLLKLKSVFVSAFIGGEEDGLHRGGEVSAGHGWSRCALGQCASVRAGLPAPLPRRGGLCLGPALLQQKD